MSKEGLFYVAVEAIIEKDGKILVTKRAPGRDHAPGEWETLTGRVDQGETFEEAVKREVREEVGLEVEVIQPFGTFHFYRGSEKVEHLGVSFWCKYKAGKVVLDEREQVEYRWVTPSEAMELIKDKSILRAVRKVKRLIEEKE
jgi:8-oxo-dGTP diphosphatase